MRGGVLLLCLRNLRKNYVGELCLEYFFGSEIEKETSDKVLKVYKFLKQNLDFKELYILDILPTYTTTKYFFR